jgi:hypothetical protein
VRAPSKPFWWWSKRPLARVPHAADVDGEIGLPRSMAMSRVRTRPASGIQDLQDGDGPRVVRVEFTAVGCNQHCVLQVGLFSAASYRFAADPDTPIVRRLQYHVEQTFTLEKKCSLAWPPFLN